MFKGSNQLVSWYSYTTYGDILNSYINTDIAYKFTGQEYDNETNLWNFRARLYDSGIERFYASDPAGQGFAPYSYCGNNPVMRVDRNGRFFWIPVVIAAVETGIIGYKRGDKGLNLIKDVAEGAAIAYGGNIIGGIAGALTSEVAGEWNLPVANLLANGVGAGMNSVVSDYGFSQFSSNSVHGGAFFNGFIGGFIAGMGGPYMVAAGGFTSGLIGSHGKLLDGAISASFSLLDYEVESKIRYDKKTGYDVLDKNRKEIDQKIEEGLIGTKEAGIWYDRNNNLEDDWKFGPYNNEIGKYETNLGVKPDDAIGSIHSHPNLNGPSEGDSFLPTANHNFVISTGNLYYSTHVIGGSSSDYFMFNYYTRISYFGYHY